MLELKNWSDWASDRHGDMIATSRGKIVVVVGHGMYGDFEAILASASFGFVGCQFLLSIFAIWQPRCVFVPPVQLGRSSALLPICL